MSSVLLILAGCSVGWLAHSFFVRFGLKWIGRDAEVRSKLLDGLGYGALLKLQASVDAELAKRRQPQDMR